MRIPIAISGLFMLMIACKSGGEQTSQKFDEPVSSLYDPQRKPFYHGVASGDPLTDRVIIWTRVTPEELVSSVEVKWELSPRETFEPVLKSGVVATTPERDYTVKADVEGLQPNTRYFYRFTALGKTSETGRTKTLPEGNVDSVTFAVVSCSNWQHGYFNAYERLADKTVDVVVHLGDYIYEYGITHVKNANRRHLPEHEVITLSDYRTRYSQYHLDDALRRMRQNHPLITIWDDHEVANNTFVEGAQNHQPEEGDFAARKEAARQAYYEWIPIREGSKHYRMFSFGNLADLIMLDERLEGKSKPAQGETDSVYTDESRTMLGQEQLAWFESALKNSTATWKLIGNQVLFSDMDRPTYTKNMDSWDGYPVEKQKIGDFIRTNNLKNIIILTGDTHQSWAFEVKADPLDKVPAAVERPIAVEFGAPSVSSTNANESQPDDLVIESERLFIKSNPHLKYVNRRDHGYVIVTVSAEKARADWYYVGTVVQPDTTETLAKTLHVALNSTSLK